jgi:hypothetical protein
LAFESIDFPGEDDTSKGDRPCNLEGGDPRGEGDGFCRLTEGRQKAGQNCQGILRARCAVRAVLAEGGFFLGVTCIVLLGGKGVNEKTDGPN